jgi:holo-[acyl-carrier protein] synthase
MSSAYQRHGERLVRRVCVPTEVARVLRAQAPVRELSGIFAVKEAVMKALGTGMRGVGWKEIRTDTELEGSIDRLLSGRALAVARRRGAERYAFSVTASEELAIATVLLNGHGQV